LLLEPPILSSKAEIFQPCVRWVWMRTWRAWNRTGSRRVPQMIQVMYGSPFECWNCEFETILETHYVAWGSPILPKNIYHNICIYISGWWSGTLTNIFHNIWDNPSHRLSYISRWLKPPTRYNIYIYIYIHADTYKVAGGECNPTYKWPAWAKSPRGELMRISGTRWCFPFFSVLCHCSIPFFNGWKCDDPFFWLLFSRVGSVDHDTIFMLAPDECHGTLLWEICVSKLSILVFVRGGPLLWDFFCSDPICF